MGAARKVTAQTYEAAIASMSPRALRAPESYYGIDDKTGKPRRPHPKQAAFLGLTCREAMYGGAAGGGKSDALLMAALQYVHVPGYSAILFRRTFKDLSMPGAIMDRAETWLRSSDARWSAEKKTWTFPSGARLVFAYLDNDKDRYNYQGAAFQFIGFDELTQFPDKWYKYLFSRLRRLKGDVGLGQVPLRMRSATNPGGIGHEWVYQRFIDKDTINPGAVFVPALLKDNPSLDAVEYEASLSELDEQTRRQLRDGLWVRDVGGLIYVYQSDRNAAPAVRPDASWKFVLGIDYGFTEACAFVELGWRPGDRTVYVTRVHKAEKMLPEDAAAFARGWEQERGYQRIVGDVGGLGKGYSETARQRFALPVEPAQKANKRGYQALFRGDMEKGRIKVLHGCEELLGEWSKIPWNKDHSGEEEGFENHLADATLYGWREAYAWLEKEPQANDTRSPVQVAAAEEEKSLERLGEELERRKRRGSWARLAG